MTDTEWEGIDTLTHKHSITAFPSIPRFIYHFLRDNGKAELPCFTRWFSEHLKKVGPSFAAMEPEKFYLRVHVDSGVGTALTGYLTSVRPSELRSLEDTSSTTFPFLLCLGMIFKNSKKGFCTLLCTGEDVVLVPMSVFKTLGEPSEILAGRFAADEHAVERQYRYSIGSLFDRITPFECTGDHKFWGRDPAVKAKVPSKHKHCGEGGDFDSQPSRKKQHNNTVAVPDAPKKPPVVPRPVVVRPAPRPVVVRAAPRPTTRPMVQQDPQPVVLPPAVLPPPAPPPAELPPPPAPPPVVLPPPPAPPQPAPLYAMTRNKRILGTKALHAGIDPDSLARSHSVTLEYAAELCMRALRDSNPAAFNMMLDRLPRALCPAEAQPAPAPAPAPLLIIPRLERVPLAPDPMQSFEGSAGLGDEAHLKAICVGFRQAIGCKIPDESGKPYHIDHIRAHPEEDPWLVFTWSSAEPVLPPTLKALALGCGIQLKQQLILIIIDGFGASSYLVWLFLTRANKLPGFARNQYKGAIAVLNAMGRELLPILHEFGLDYLRSGGLFDPIERKYRPLDEMKLFIENASEKLREDYLDAVAKYSEPRPGMPDQYLGLSLARRLGFNEICHTEDFAATAARMRRLADSWYKRDMTKDPGPVLPLFFPEGFAVQAKTLKADERAALSDCNLDPFELPPC